MKVESFKKCVTSDDYITCYRQQKRGVTIDQTEIVSFLKSLEGLDKPKSLLGTLLIAHVVEKEISNNYINDFFERNKYEIKHNVQIKSKVNVIYMQMLYICFMHFSDEKTLLICNDIFSENIYREIDKDNQFVEMLSSQFGVTKYYAILFIIALSNFNSEIQWEEKYISIVLAIYEARNKDVVFLRLVEKTGRRIMFGNKLTTLEAKKYFEFLCEQKEYEAIYYFLNRMDVNKRIFDIDPEELTDQLIRYPFPQLLIFCKGYRRKWRGEYTWDEWAQDILKVNRDGEIIKWVKMNTFFRKLRDSVAENDTEEFYRALSAASEYQMIDLQQNSYIKRILDNFEFVLNSLVLTGKKDAIYFLKRIAHINIYSYDCVEELYQKRINFWDWNDRERINEFDYNDIEAALLDNYGVEELVYIYMNSHLRLNINLEHIIARCAEANGNIKELFSIYPIYGKISYVDKRASSRNKYFLDVRDFANDIRYNTYKEICTANEDKGGKNSFEAKNYYKKLLRIEENWVSYNKGYADLLVKSTYCKLYICAYLKDEGILANNIDIINDKAQAENEKKREEDFPKYILNWLEQIKESNKFIDWNYKEQNVFSVRFIENDFTRIQIAEEILNTIVSLRNNTAELEEFLFAITHPPLEELNEFRYISSQKKLRFDVTPKQKRILSKISWDAAEVILREDNLSAKLKARICVNTCIRKFCDFYRVCDFLEDEISIEKREEPLYLGLQFEKYENGVGYFSTKTSVNTFFSFKKFIYKGDCSSLTPGLYITELKCRDTDNECFVLNRVNLDSEDLDHWFKFLRKLREIKMKKSLKDVKTVCEEAKAYDIDIGTKEKICRFTYELDLIFSDSDYDLERATCILESIKEVNPFANEANNYMELREEFVRDYTKSYEKFLNSYKKNNEWTYLLDLYFMSYLHVFITRDELFEWMCNNGNIEIGTIKNYCRFKKYL